MQEAAAEALARISAGSQEVGARLLASPGLLDDLARRCRDPDPKLRLTACSTLAHVTRCQHPKDSLLHTVSCPPTCLLRKGIGGWGCRGWTPSCTGQAATWRA